MKTPTNSHATYIALAKMAYKYANNLNLSDRMFALSDTVEAVERDIDAFNTVVTMTTRGKNRIILQNILSRIVRGLTFKAVKICEFPTSDICGLFLNNDYVEVMEMTRSKALYMASVKLEKTLVVYAKQYGAIANEIQGTEQC